MGCPRPLDGPAGAGLHAGGKLGDVEENDNSAWLPSNAESTRVVERAEKFQPADTLPAIVIYDRPEGVTPART